MDGKNSLTSPSQQALTPETNFKRRGLLVMGAGIAGLITLLVLAFGDGAPPTASVTQTPDIFPTVGMRPTYTPITSSPPENAIRLPTKQGEVTVKNFYRTAAFIHRDYVLMENNPGFQITFLAKGPSFLISIIAEPVNTNRQTAERMLLQELDISQQDACKFEVNLAVSHEVRLDLAGQDFGLSFCPDGIPFP